MAISRLPGILPGSSAIRDNLARVREGKLRPGINHPFFHDGSVYTVFAHQVPMLGGVYNGDWKIRDFQGLHLFVGARPKLEVATRTDVSSCCRPL